MSLGIARKADRQPTQITAGARALIPGAAMLSCIRPASWSATEEHHQEGQHAQGQEQGHSQPEGPPDLIPDGPRALASLTSLDTATGSPRWRW